MVQKEKRDASELFYAFFSLIKPRPIKTPKESASIIDQWQSHVLPHGSIEELAQNLWHVTGIFPAAVVPREMVLYKLPDSTLLIHSAIALNQQAMAQLESLGTPRIMIVPNRIHRFDASLYKQRYPELLVVCPAAAKEYVEEVVPVNGIAEEILPKYGIICHQPLGLRPQELAYELPLPTGKALVFTDILFNLTESYLQQYPPNNRWILRWLGASGYFGITALGKRFFMTDKNAYRHWLEALADNIQDLQVICVAHGEPITVDCSERLREAAARLL
ncbi:hypothetical protein [Fischerella sp. JS2]|uniref:hypothetical protein n=1 Tax=Fischerella sp. JS2 TaxID=2597771 RepID=UPI0028E23B98|nr:hypothetical protein [Fischerella sp. JS2]